MDNKKCVPCEMKKVLNIQKKEFLINQALCRSKENNEDYVIYMENGSYKTTSLDSALQRGEQIIQVISRFEKPSIR